MCSTPGGAPGSSVIPPQPPRQKALGFRVALKRRAGCAHSQACARKLCHCLRAAACDFVRTSPATKLTHLFGKLSHFLRFGAVAPPGSCRAASRCPVQAPNGTFCYTKRSSLNDLWSGATACMHRVVRFVAQNRALK